MSTVQHAVHRGPGRPRLTYADYLGLPEDGRRYEILDGELAVTPVPTTRHQRVSANLEYVLMGHVRGLGLGTILYAPVDVILANDCIVQPDIVFVAAGREEIIKLRGIEGAPDSTRATQSSTQRRLRRCAWLSARSGSERPLRSRARQPRDESDSSLQSSSWSRTGSSTPLSCATPRSEKRKRLPATS